MIKIKITSQKPRTEDGYSFYEGIITINNHEQEFNIPLTDWSLQDYKKQWKNAFNEIKKEAQSCLIIHVADLKTDPFIIMYCMYKKNKNIYIQYSIIGSMQGDTPATFSILSPNSYQKFIPEYQIYPDDGCDYFKLIIDISEKNYIFDENGHTTQY